MVVRGSPGQRNEHGLLVRRAGGEHRDEPGALDRNGPAVSSGMTGQSAAAAADPLAPDDVPLAVDVGNDEPLADGSQATIDISPRADRRQACELEDLASIDEGREVIDEAAIGLLELLVEGDGSTGFVLRDQRVGLHFRSFLRDQSER
jgi:hypothetical protein